VFTDKVSLQVVLQFRPVFALGATEGNGVLGVPHVEVTFHLREVTVHVRAMTTFVDSETPLIRYPPVLIVSEGFVLQLWNRKRKECFSKIRINLNFCGFLFYFFYKGR
jgi:hypothetical protein